MPFVEVEDDLYSPNLSSVKLAPNQPQRPGKMPFFPQDLGAFPRVVAQTAARSAESILGLPGDIPRGLQGLYQSLTGRPEAFAPTQEEFKQFVSQLPPQAQEQLKGAEVPKSLSSELREAIPGSQDIREFGKKATGGMLEPQSKLEGVWGDLVSGAAPFLLGGELPTAGKVVRALTSTGLNNVAHMVTQKLPIGEGWKTAINVITPFVTGTITSQVGGLKQLEKIEQQNYKQFREGIQGMSTNPRKLTANIRKKTKRMGKPNYPGGNEVKEAAENVMSNIFSETPTITTPEQIIPGKVSPIVDASGRPIVSPETRIPARVQKGKVQPVSLEKLWEEKKGINQMLSEPKWAKPEYATARRKLIELSDTITEELTTAANKQSKGLGNFLSAGDELFKGKLLNEGMAKWINDKVKLKDVIKSPIYHLGLTGAAHALGPAGIAKAIVAGSSIGAINKWISYINNSPIAAKHYGRMYTNMLTGNVADAIKIAKLENKKIEKFTRGKFIEVT